MASIEVKSGPTYVKQTTGQNVIRLQCYFILNVFDEKVDEEWFTISLYSMEKVMSLVSGLENGLKDKINELEPC